MVFYSGRMEILDSLKFLEVLAFQLGTGGEKKNQGSTVPESNGELMAEVFMSRTGVDTC